MILGFKEANKYVIINPHGNYIGYMAERDLGIDNIMKRQFSIPTEALRYIFLIRIKGKS